MKKTYIIRARNYRDAVEKVKRLSLKDSYTDNDKQILEEAMNLTKGAIVSLQHVNEILSDVYTPIDETIDCAEDTLENLKKLHNCLSNDAGYEEFYKKVEENDEDHTHDDIVKTSKGWTNKGEEGTHGTFKTKKAAREQQKAMFANGYKGRDSIHPQTRKYAGVYSDLSKEYDKYVDGVFMGTPEDEEDIEKALLYIKHKHPRMTYEDFLEWQKEEYAPFSQLDGDDKNALHKIAKIIFK